MNKVHRTDSDWQKIVYEVDQAMKAGATLSDATKKIGVAKGTFYGHMKRYGIKIPGSSASPRKYKKSGKYKAAAKMIEFRQTESGFTQVADVNVTILAGDMKIMCQLGDLKAVLAAVRCMEA